ncbi:MAG: HAD-IA family hydrolase [Anaerolineales bacterium]|nr:HAD-IA family hydrolase [Anaerolineales bacterium]
MLSHSTIVFDVGGTLLQLDYDALARLYVQAAAARGVALEFAQARVVLEILESEMPHRQRHRPVSLENDDGKSFWDEFFTDGFRLLGVPGDVSREVTEIRERFQRGEFEALYEDVIPVLDALRAQSKRLGILSNFSPNLENILRQVGVHHYFSFFVVSALVGVEKPDPRIFDLTARAAQSPHAEIVYIGDSIFHDVEGARAVGMMGILVDRRDQHPEFNGARVRDLRELVR